MLQPFHNDPGLVGCKISEKKIKKCPVQLAKKRNVYSL